MTFFSAVRKYTASSVKPHWVNQSRMFEKGSLTGFITWKSYNRCRKIYQTFVVMETLHFGEFDSRFSNESQSVTNDELND